MNRFIECLIYWNGIDGPARYWSTKELSFVERYEATLFSYHNAVSFIKPLNIAYNTKGFFWCVECKNEKDNKLISML